MIDVVTAGLNAAATRSPFALPLVFAAGVATSAGPCVAPRYVAVAALAQAAGRPWAVVTAFVAGLVGTYAMLGLVAGAVGTLSLKSNLVYAVMAAALGVAGVATLLRGDAHVCDASHAVSRRATSAGNTRGSLGATFVLGAASAFVVSPCCTPVLAAIAGLTIAGTRAVEGVVLLVAFACGHAVPLLGAAFAGRRVAGALARMAASQAPAIVSGSLMLALGAYYGVLA